MEPEPTKADYLALKEELQKVKDFYSLALLEDLGTKTKQVHDEIRAANDRKARRETWVAVMSGALIPLLVIFVSTKLTNSTEERKLVAEKIKVAAEVYNKAIEKPDGAAWLSTAHALRKMLPEDSSFATALNELAKKKYPVLINLAAAITDSMQHKAAIAAVGKEVAQAADSSHHAPTVQQRALLKQVQAGAALQQTSTGPEAAKLAAVSKSVLYDAALSREHQAYDALLHGQLKDATERFKQTEQLVHGFKTAYETSRYLAQYARNNGVNGPLTPAQLAEIARELLRTKKIIGRPTYNYKMPTDVQQQLQAATKAPVIVGQGGKEPDKRKLNETIKVEPVVMAPKWVGRMIKRRTRPYDCTINPQVAPADWGQVKYVLYSFGKVCGLQPRRGNPDDGFKYTYSGFKKEICACDSIGVKVHFVDESVKNIRISAK